MTEPRPDRLYLLGSSLGLVALSLLLRFPLFFVDSLDWDEGTFILMGQSLLDGHLPYTELFDVKPPLAFACYALFIALLGKSIVAVRLAGALCVAAVGVLTLRVGNALWGRRVALVAGAGTVVLLGLLPSGQATTTEHVALIPLLGGLVVLVTARPGPRTLLMAGALVGCAAFIRLNLACVAAVVGLVALVGGPLRPLRSPALRALAWAGGVCLPGALTLLPYALTGQARLWWTSVVEASLGYAGEQLPLAAVLRAEVRSLAAVAWAEGGASLLLAALVGLGAGAGVVLVVARWGTTAGRERRGLALLLAVLVGTEASVVLGGAWFGHYLLLLAPFAALLAASALGPLLDRRPWLAAGALATVVALGAGPVVTEYVLLAARARAHRPLTHGPAYELADLLRRENPTREPVLLLTDHVVYWLTGTWPPTRVCHPSNLAKPFLLRAACGPDATTAGELARILARRPRFVVTRADLWYLRREPAARRLLDGALRDDYRLEREVEGRLVYRLK